MILYMYIGGEPTGMSTLMSQLNSHNIKLTLSAWLNAETFAKEQKNLSKSRQVYLNTLAVSAVNLYLQCLGWETDLENSYSWNSELRSLLNVADLQISGYGRVECLCLDENSQQLSISQDLSRDTIACIAVSLPAQSQFATILGFTTETNSNTIAVDSLLPIDDFPAYLASYPAARDLPQPLIPLKAWSTGEVVTGWLGWDNFCQDYPEMVFRSPQTQTEERELEIEEVDAVASPHNRRVKVWRLEADNQKSNTVALIVELQEKTDNTVDIAIEICPADNLRLLPTGLIVDILDEEQKLVLHTHIQPDSELIEFSLNGRSGEVFSIRATFNATSITESFKI